MAAPTSSVSGWSWRAGWAGSRRCDGGWLWPHRRQGRPYWADDPAFGAGRHITSTDLPARVSFAEWCAPAILRPLDRSRPLWRAEVVGRLPGGPVGVLIVAPARCPPGCACWAICWCRCSSWAAWLCHQQLGSLRDPGDFAVRAARLGGRGQLDDRPPLDHMTSACPE